MYWLLCQVETMDIEDWNLNQINHIICENKLYNIELHLLLLGFIVEQNC